MTPEEIDQLIGEKVAAAISAYAAAQNSGEGSKPVGGQNTAAKDAEGNQGKNTAQHQSKKQKMVETSDAGQSVKRGYAGKIPYCGSCDKHHTGHCAMICNQCKMVGYTTRDCRNPTPVAKAMMAKNVEEGCAKGKSKWNDNQERNLIQHSNKWQKVVEADNAGRRYKGKLPYCNKCGKHHTGHCTNICNKCKRFGHKAKDCRIAAPMPITAVPMTCYECEEVGHFKKNCPKLKKQTLKQPKEEPI